MTKRTDKPFQVGDLLHESSLGVYGLVTGIYKAGWAGNEYYYVFWFPRGSQNDCKIEFCSNYDLRNFDLVQRSDI